MITSALSPVHLQGATFHIGPLDLIHLLDLPTIPMFELIAPHKMKSALIHPYRYLYAHGRLWCCWIGASIEFQVMSV